MMENQDFPSMETPFTILLGPLLLVSTPWFMLDVLQKLTLLLLLTKYVSLVVEFRQV